MQLSQTEREQLYAILEQYDHHPKVQEMREFIQHGDVTTYQHCKNVVLVSFWLNRRFHLIALVSHASGCLADEPHGLWLDIVGVSGQGSGDCAFREPQLSGYVDNGGVFHAMVVFLQS